MITTKEKQKILIVGGGISGHTLGIALALKGMLSEIVENKKEWAVNGVGIIQQANVVRAMLGLGISEYIDQSFAYDDITVHDANGNFLDNIPSERVAGPEFPSNVGISRLDLHNLLHKKAVSLGVKVRIGLSIQFLKQENEKVNVEFTDGSTSIYDLVVGADGIHSKVRQLIFGDKYTIKYTGQMCWRTTFDRLPEVDHLMMYYGHKGNVGLVPMAHNKMYMFYTESVKEKTFLSGQELINGLKKHLKEFGGLIPGLASSITNPEMIVCRPFEFVFVDEAWYVGRVVLIGDAAHTTTAHAGQGGGIAMEDAAVLAEELAKDQLLDAALQNFHKRRFDRCKLVAEGSHQIGIWEEEGESGGKRMEMLKTISQETLKPI